MTRPWIERVWRNLNFADISRGSVPNSSVFGIFGEMTTSGPVTDHVLWETGMPVSLTVPNNIQLTVVSSNAADTGEVVIVYLDGELRQRVERLTLTGTVPVLTAATDIRAITTIYSAVNVVSGTVTFTNSGVTYAIVPAGSLQFNTAMQRVPAGKRFMISGAYAGSISGSAAARAVIKLETTFLFGDSFAEQGIFRPLGAIPVQDGTAPPSPITPPIPIPPGEWVGFTVTCDKSATVAAGAFGWLEDV